MAATITVHHLILTIDDVVGKNHHYCKPVAKYPMDREALWNVIREGHPKFFLGTDSAPHTKRQKETHQANAGVFTLPYVLPYLATLFEEKQCLDRLKGFACEFGRRFYAIAEERATVLVRRRPCLISPTVFECDGETDEIIPFLCQQTLPWSVVDQSE